MAKSTPSRDKQHKGAVRLHSLTYKPKSKKVVRASAKAGRVAGKKTSTKSAKGVRK